MTPIMSLLLTIPRDVVGEGLTSIEERLGNPAVSLDCFEIIFFDHVDEGGWIED